ncbi:hypothetical protein R70211_06964 [Paraburkholderia domus]|uniref:Uncharacterized protein n=1 Tax=Paraburkholderia domus TaxID=2793075 RepID=A0A9N8N713_9BURK|nr:hypothetical protein R70211_06964 [Paraburkholderia domus]
MRNASRFDAAFQVPMYLTNPGTDAEISDRWSRNLSLMIAGQAKKCLNERSPPRQRLFTVPIHG